jgi:hypothetical protein
VSSASPKSRETSSMPRTAAPEQETRNAPENPANDAVKSLQRDAGNQGVSRLMARSSGLMAGNSGRPLDPGTREEMETKFSADFGDVRIHSDGTAAETALNAGARAIVTGNDIAFGPGFYAPASGTGKRLLAHELAHVIQQKGQGDRVVCDSAAESEARQAGADVAAGQAATVRGAVSTGAQADGMTKEEIQKQIADLETKAFATKDPQETDKLYQQRQALMQKLHDTELFPSLPPPQSIAPPSAKVRKPDPSVRKTALEIGEHELDRPAWPGFSFGRKPSGPRDLTSVRGIVRDGTPLRKSVAITHWGSRAEVEQFMQDYITVADEDPATKPQADQARRDRKLILQELDTAEEDVLAGRLKLAEGEQHVEDVTAMMHVPVPEVLKPGIAAAEVVGIGGTNVVDALVDFVPYVGEVKMLLEAATGMTISGQLNKAAYAPEELGTADLDALDRIMRILPLAIAGASKIASHAPGWAEALTKLRKGTNLSEQALQTAISDTAKLAGREQEVAHALLEARKRARAAVSLEERAGLLEQKPANTNALLPNEPQSNVIPLRQPAVQHGKADLAVAAGHDVQAPAVNRPVASAGTGGKGAPPTAQPVTKLPPGPKPASTPMAVRDQPLPEGTHEIRSRPNQRTQSLSDEEALRANMEARGKTVPPGHDAHHLVPKKGGGTWGAIARQRLRKLGISINDADNGAALPGSSIPRGTAFEPEGGPFHGTVHTEAYFKEIASRVARARTQAEGRAILRQIEAEIRDGKFPN